MIVPEFWSESRQQSRSRERQVTVRRWGWSDVSQAEADAMAEARAAEALERALADPKTPRREPKVPYNGAEGVPIREEIVSRHGDAVVTRNSYGARCLNTPDALFADVDFQYFAGCRATMWTWLVLAVAGVVLVLSTGPLRERVGLAVGSVLVALVAAWPVANVLFHLVRRAKGGIKQWTIGRIRAFADANPRWNLRIYETPAGLRVLATHSRFDARSDEVAAFFRAIGVDPIYARMCIRQNCFRARLTAKPWRCGVETHMKPRPGVWPVSVDRMPERAAWVAAYERVAAGFASCSFIESAGSGITDPAVRTVVELHDVECRALDAGVPLA